MKFTSGGLFPLFFFDQDQRYEWARSKSGAYDTARPRAPYAFGLLAAADLARFFGFTKLSAIEFAARQFDWLL